MEDYKSWYSEYIRPEMGPMLRAVGLDIAYEKAAGNFLYYRNTEGDEIEVSDFLGGYGSCLAGHNHPEIIQAAGEFFGQQKPVWAQASIRTESAKLAKTLSEKVSRPGEKYISVFGSTGAEAVEIAIKHASFALSKNRQKKIKTALFGKPVSMECSAAAEEMITMHGNGSWPECLGFVLEHNRKVAEGPVVFFALNNAFHGQTNAALAATFNKAFRTNNSQAVVDVHFISRDDPAFLEQAIRELRTFYFEWQIKDDVIRLGVREHIPVAGFIIEPILGEGGIIPLEKSIAQSWETICSSYGVPLIADEIQSGMGRTGSFLYSSQLGINPGYILLSKSLGGGIAKISCCMIHESFYLPGFSLMHASTFAEDDFSASVAMKSLEILERDQVKNVIQHQGEKLLQSLNDVKNQFPDLIECIRGRGLMLGIVFHSRIEFDSFMLHYFKEKDLLGYALAGYLLHHYNCRVAPALSQNRVIRVEPSYLVSDHEINMLAAGIKDICEILQHNNIKKLIGHTLRLEEPVNNMRSDASPKRHIKSPEPITSVAFIGHYIEAEDISLWDPYLQGWSKKEYADLLDITEPAASPLLFDPVTVRGPHNSVNFYFIGIPLTSSQIYRAMVHHDTMRIRDIISKGVDLAVDAGCSMVGLGGYTSILTRNGKDLLDKSTYITTGNSFTAGSAFDALMISAKQHMIDVNASVAAIVGANGNIGSIMAAMLYEEAASLILIGRKNRLEPLNKLKKSLLENSGFTKEIIITDDLNMLRDASLIVSASNAPSPLIFTEMLGEHETVICDISIPSDVDSAVAGKGNVHLIQGGIISSALNKKFRVPGIPLQDGELFACMTETILLGLEGTSSHFSIGDISIQQVKEMQRLAAKHQFYVSRHKHEAIF
jgi:acetylornithine/succinyldiaminopimelate/putrescine aminotransferase/predicted amino acid dehydrogenase